MGLCCPLQKSRCGVDLRLCDRVSKSKMNRVVAIAVVGRLFAFELVDYYIWLSGHSLLGAASSINSNGSEREI